MFLHSPTWRVQFESSVNTLTNATWLTNVKTKDLWGHLNVYCVTVDVTLWNKGTFLFHRLFFSNSWNSNGLYTVRPLTLVSMWVMTVVTAARPRGALHLRVRVNNIWREASEITSLPRTMERQGETTSLPFNSTQINSGRGSDTPFWNYRYLHRVQSGMLSSCSQNREVIQKYRKVTGK